MVEKHTRGMSRSWCTGPPWPALPGLLPRAHLRGTQLETPRTRKGHLLPQEVAPLRGPTVHPRVPGRENRENLGFEEVY